MYSSVYCTNSVQMPSKKLILILILLLPVCQNRVKKNKQPLAKVVWFSTKSGCSHCYSSLGYHRCWAAYGVYMVSPHDCHQCHLSDPADQCGGGQNKVELLILGYNWD